MSSNKTANLNLHLWEAEDAFLRTEFNENSQLLDEAYAELKNQINKNHAQMMEGTLSKSVTKWNLDFSALTLTDYWKVELLLDCPLENDKLYLRVNDLASGYVRFAPDGTASTGQTSLTTIVNPGKQPFRLEFCHMNEGTYVSVMGSQLHYEDGNCRMESLSGIAPVLWEDMTSLQIIPAGGVLPAGSHLFLRALKK